jgi:hypothetical protein
MQGNAVAFRIDNHSAKSVLPDLLPCPQDFSAIGSRSFNRFVQTAFDRKINQRSICRRSVIDASTIGANAKTTGGIA